MLDQKVPILILNASAQPYLSIGVRYGRIKAFGCEYTYIRKQDAFLRKDYIEQYKEYKKTKDWISFVEYIASVDDNPAT